MTDEFDFNTNLMRFLAGQLHFSLSMTAAREMFAKSYFALGVAEKAVVDQMVTANVAGNFQQLTPAILAAQQAQQPVGVLESQPPHQQRKSHNVAPSPIPKF
jgi:hypothetical protein